MSKIKQEQKTFTIAFGETMAALRVERGWSQSTLAERLGIKQGNVSGWECGKNHARAYWVPLLCQEFGIEPNAFYKLIEEKLSP